MKQLKTNIICILILPILFFAFTLPERHGDEPTELLYSKQAIERLKKEIERKNATFDADAANLSFLPVPQGIAGYLSVEGAKASEIKRLIEERASWKKVAALLREKEKTDTVYFIKYRGIEGVSFHPLEMNQDYRQPIHTEEPDKYEKDLSGKWVYSYYPKTDYSGESIHALFIRRELKPRALPLAVVSCIGYADHLIDTNTIIFSQTSTSSFRDYSYKVNPVVDKLIKLTQNFPGKPIWQQDTTRSINEKYYQDYDRWEKARETYVHEKLSKTEDFQTLLNAAYKEVTQSDTANHYAIDEFESYVEKYISPSAALALKRKRVVVGQCSMDSGPIYHATNIARLAGETCCMEIFLRSHLNILYDRFERVSDGSYAEGGRKTYARELEVLGTKLEYLIPGTLLTSRNLAKNHYRGDVSRAGRAMAELESRKKVYEKIEGLINMESLDLYNRVMLVVLAQSYNYYLFENKEPEEARQNLKKLQKSLIAFPDHIRKPLTKRIASIQS